MEDGKEDFTTDSFPSLVFLSARLVYYINLNCMYNLEKTVVDTYYCQCLKYSGCRKPNGVMDYCDICSLSIKHCPYDNEKNYRVKDLINKHIELVDDFTKYNPDIYVGDYESKTFEAVFSIWSFYNSVFVVCLLKKIPFINHSFIYRHNGILSTNTRIKKLFSAVV